MPAHSRPPERAPAPARQRPEQQPQLSAALEVATHRGQALGCRESQAGDARAVVLCRGQRPAQELSAPSSWARLGQRPQAAPGPPEPRTLPVWPGQVLPCWSAGSPLWGTVTSRESRCLGPTPEGLGCGLDMAHLNLLKELSCVAQTGTHARLLLVGAAHVPYRRRRR